MSTQNKLYPHPTIVVGVGKFGLSCLEFLGEKWISRKSTGGDTSCRNLRLLHLDYNEKKVDPTDWPKVEKRISDFLSQMRTDDMPVQSLDMLILRTMGLIRFRDGHFQACYPKDGGFISMVEEDVFFRFPTADEKEKNDGSKLYRQKYFEWVSLGTDPLVAVQNLADLRGGNPEYDHFVGAILHRVRLGHSPNILLRMIFRSTELCEHGVDPSPWSWVHQVADQYTASEESSPDEDVLKVSVAVGDEVRYAPFLQSDAPSKSTKKKGKSDISEARDQLVETVGQTFFDAWGELLPSQFLTWDEEQQSVLKESIQVPKCNLFRTPIDATDAAIYTTPYQNMYNILKQDFSNKEGEDALRLLPVSDFQLGMIDSDSWSRNKEYYAHLTKRLKEYGRLTYQGLLLLWSSLEQSVTVNDFNGGADSHQEVLQKSVKQSLAFLGQLMVKKHLFGTPSIHAGGAKRQPTDVWTDGLDLPTEASNQLQRAQVNSYSGQSKEIQELYERLIEIGVPIEESQEITRNLYNRIDFDPVSLNPHIQDIQMGSVSGTDLDDTKENSEHHISDKDFLENEAVLHLRQRINAELRHLYSLDNLRSVNKGIHRQPPALKVFVVADFHDPFARVALQPLLKSISAEIFRTIHSVFQIERGGVWKNTSVVPLIWLPNPTDPTVGEVVTRERRNRESAVSLYAVHSLRKWLESIPKDSCNFRQIFLNSRMTDNAYLGTRDATTQTAHFIEYQITNQFGDVKDLDATQAFIDVDSVFASFACQLIDFPETRTREYLATLLGLDFLQRVRDNRSTDRVSPIIENAEDPSNNTETSQELKTNIYDVLDQQATNASNNHKVRFPELDTTLESVFSTLTQEHLQNIKGEVKRSWNTFVSDSGHLDSLLRSFHIETERASQDRIKEAFANTNQQFIKTVADNGVDKARQFLNQQKFKHDEELRDMDAKIHTQSKLCKSQDVPELNTLNPLFEDIKAKSLERLDLRSEGYMTFIFALWCSIGIASIVWMTMQYFEMQNNPSVFEWVVWRGLPIVLVVGACILFQRLLKQKAEELHEEFLEASSRFDNRLQQLFVAESGSLFSFFGSRSDLSLMNKQREYNSNAVEQAVFDQRLGERFQQSVDLQETLLQQHLEELGVRLTSGTLDEQDPSLLFTVYSANYNYNLLRPEIIRQHYLQHCPPDSQRFWSKKVGDMLRDLGDLEKWRVSAPLSNTETILDYGRNEEEFQQFVDHPLIKQDQNIRDDLFYNIMDFILVNHPNTGVGADFDGYRGLDSNNVQSVVCTLVLHEDMQKGLEQEVTRIIEHKSDRFEDAERIRTIIKNSRISQTIRSNSVCLYSISTGISTRIIQNLKRFHTPLERVEPVLETLFPFGAEVSSYQENKRHLNPLPPFGLTDMDWIGQKVHLSSSGDLPPHEGETDEAPLDKPEVDASDETSSGDKS